MKTNYKLLSTLINLSKLNLCQISLSPLAMDVVFDSLGGTKTSSNDLDNLLALCGWDDDPQLKGYNSIIILNDLQKINCSSLKELRINCEKLIKLKVML